MTVSRRSTDIGQCTLNSVLDAGQWYVSRSGHFNDGERVLLDAVAPVRNETPSVPSSSLRITFVKDVFRPINGKETRKNSHVYETVQIFPQL